MNFGIYYLQIKENAIYYTYRITDAVIFNLMQKGDKLNTWKSELDISLLGEVISA